MPNDKIVRLVEGGGYRPKGDVTKISCAPKGAGTGVRFLKNKRSGAEAKPSPKGRASPRKEG